MGTQNSTTDDQLFSGPVTFPTQCHIQTRMPQRSQLLCSNLVTTAVINLNAETQTRLRHRRNSLTQYLHSTPCGDVVKTEITSSNLPF